MLILNAGEKVHAAAAALLAVEAVAGDHATMRDGPSCYRVELVRSGNAFERIAVVGVVVDTPLLSTGWRRWSGCSGQTTSSFRRKGLFHCDEKRTVGSCAVARRRMLSGGWRAAAAAHVRRLTGLTLSHVEAASVSPASVLHACHSAPQTVRRSPVHNGPVRSVICASRCSGR